MALDLIGCDEAGTLWGLFCERVRRSHHSIAYREYDRTSQTWRAYTWHDIAERTDRMRSALARVGLNAGDRVAVLLANGTDWVCLDLAALSLGLVVVALYPHDSPANNAYIVGNSDARLLLLDTPDRWQSLVAHRSEFPALEQVWIREGESPPTGETHLTVKCLGGVITDLGRVPSVPINPTSLATLIYTSGTTGRPKGVMLSHRALLWNVEASATIIPPAPDDAFLSILPLAHAFERTVGYYLAMSGGSTVAYARSPQELRDDLLTIHPTVLLGVPRLYERIYASIRSKAEKSALKRLLLLHATALGWRQFEATQHRGPALGFFGRLYWALLRRLVSARAMAAFGGRMRVAVSGGAPLDEEIARFLISLGLPLVEGYGLTEAAPVVTANGPDDNFPGSVGRPLPGIDLRIGERGELLVHSPAAMMGYWKDEAQTAQALDADGWLSTGDIAEIRDGRVFIRGRLKELIVLSTGEKVNPNVVEAELVRDMLFDQVAVVGDGRPFVAALVVLNDAAWKRFAEHHNVDPKLLNTQSVQARVQARIETLLASLPKHARVRAVHLGTEPWTIDSGLLTPTLKVKREALQQRFSHEIDALYAGH
ncbi:MAG TPA: AMP-dependent synthetase/ligase [Pseudolabrys sp.]|nr:AMP-dependent synthetase/ligase [Pseudolabrys sp.]